MINYKAPKPTYTYGEWTRYIASRVFLFPWVGFSYLANNWQGAKIGSMILPAAGNALVNEFVNYFHSEKDEEIKLLLEYFRSNNMDKEELTKWFHAKYPNLRALKTNQENVLQKFEVITHDGAKLDGIEVKPKLEADKKTQKHIIKFIGNGRCYEAFLNEMIKEANDLNATVIGFNLRGVGNSTSRAKSADDLVIDGIAQVQRLLDDGVPPENITLQGHSLGGCISTLVAQHFHRQKQHINLFNDRSFSSITNILVGQMRVKGSKTGYKESTGGIIKGFLAKPLLWLAVNFVKWEFDAGDAYLELPKAYREHMLVRSPKSEREKENSKIQDDTIIVHYASIHAYAKSERTAEKKQFKQLLAKKDKKVDDTVLNEKLANLKAGKMFDINPKGFSHITEYSELKNRYGQNANEFFNQFVNRAYEDHGVKLSKT